MGRFTGHLLLATAPAWQLEIDLYRMLLGGHAIRHGCKSSPQIALATPGIVGMDCQSAQIYLFEALKRRTRQGTDFWCGGTDRHPRPHNEHGDGYGYR